MRGGRACARDRTKKANDALILHTQKVINDPEYGLVISLQGDHRQGVVDFLVTCVSSPPPAPRRRRQVLTRACASVAERKLSLAN